MNPHPYDRVGLSSADLKRTGFPQNTLVLHQATLLGGEGTGEAAMRAFLFLSHTHIGGMYMKEGKTFCCVFFFGGCFTCRPESLGHLQLQQQPLGHLAQISLYRLSRALTA